jgi:hypothetical protein
MSIFTEDRPLMYRMYPAEPVIYQDIFDAEEAGAIKKIGAPHYDNTTHTASRMWNNRPIIRYGNNNQNDGDGAEVIIPDGYDTVWVRVLGDRWNAIKAYFLDDNQNLGIWTGGQRRANCYCPDGSLADSYHRVHQWLPIPAGRSGRLALISKPKTNSHFWISGLAFSKNPWKHAAQSALGYHWAMNGGTKLRWHSIWQNDVLACIDKGTNPTLMVPVIPTGQDKMLYLIEHDNSWNGCMHKGITVNGKPIERFFSTYDNPFARHWNSKFYNRYIGARIPAELIPEYVRYIPVRIDMTKQDHHLHIREAGTHDFGRSCG